MSLVISPSPIYHWCIVLEESRRPLLLSKIDVWEQCETGREERTHLICNFRAGRVGRETEVLHHSQSMRMNCVLWFIGKDGARWEQGARVWIWFLPWTPLIKARHNQMQIPRLTILGRTVLLITAEILANIACWAATGIVFSKHPALLGLALLAWVIAISWRFYHII